MKKTKHNNKLWKLKMDLNRLPLGERKDTLVLLYFLNEYREQHKAFKQLKELWLNSIYRLPKTSSEKYNSIKNGRYKTLSRMKRIFNEYLVKQKP
ncbi:MAG: hypothetical protein HKP59_10595 [Lutibacter sp.]|uniref:hypothetical protein n=1 Tax=Lutibacter sp. TaxID=1925666 RepID=UPI001812B196|nr:hypothetical protein [Lutibacter sp.]MBT8318061.1 hypothetical protein [Lutibacter sp.]NNJ58921.1 hypothetical protein [Lutibacter sp.]